MTVEATEPKMAAPTGTDRPKFVRMPTQDDLPPMRTELPEGVRLPTEDDLPYSDGELVETLRHALQAQLLMDALDVSWPDRDYFAGGNMFLYFSAEQLRNRKFRSPDFFLALDVPRRERKSWVVWDEGKGPDLIVELLSPVDGKSDRGERKQFYQDQLRVPFYVNYEPFTGDVAAFQLCSGAYVLLEPDSAGRYPFGSTKLSLVRWSGTYHGVEAEWLRWADSGGNLLPTAAELAQRERERAERLAARLRDLGVEPE